MLPERCSPRAFTGEVLAEADLLTMLEAARWAPSCYDSQAWRFVYARRETPHWYRFFGLLVPFNQSWAAGASALVILISNSLMRPPGSDKDVPSPTHSFDTGTASGYFALQANRMGWYVHAMVGFDKDRAFAELQVPVGHRVEAAYAVGRLSDPAGLPEDMRVREHPSSRSPLSDLAFEGSFGVLSHPLETPSSPGADFSRGRFAHASILIRFSSRSRRPTLTDRFKIPRGPMVSRARQGRAAEISFYARRVETRLCAPPTQPCRRQARLVGVNPSRKQWPIRRQPVEHELCKSRTPLVLRASFYVSNQSVPCIRRLVPGAPASSGSASPTKQGSVVMPVP